MKDDERKGRSERGVSRRDFLRGGAAVGLAGGGLLGRGVLAQEGQEERKVAGVAVYGPGPVAVTLRVNGQARTVAVEPRTTLLDTLRDRLELTGAKRVCDRGTCGACTVLLDGSPAYACSVLTLEVGEREVRSVESLGTVEHLHPLQAAFVDNDAQQCGFCTPGFVMAATAVLERHPHPQLEDVHHGLAGNVCRCGTYAGMRRAVLEAARERKGGRRG